MNKISIIGTGSVGSTIAYSLAIMGMASEIVMIDINTEKALGEALDIRQGLPFCAPCSIYAGNYSDTAGSNIVILTSGIARKPGQSVWSWRRPMLISPRALFRRLPSTLRTLHILLSAILWTF